MYSDCVLSVVKVLFSSYVAETVLIKKIVRKIKTIMLIFLIIVSTKPVNFFHKLTLKL